MSAPRNHSCSIIVILLLMLLVAGGVMTWWTKQAIESSVCVREVRNGQNTVSCPDKGNK